MILINVGSCIRKVINDPKLTEQIDESIAKLKKYFIHPEFKCLLETVGMNGEFVDTCMGRTINPGHCIETSWFIMEEAKQRGWDKEITDMALQIFDWSWDWGWDKQYGGIINFRDCRNLPSQDYSQDMKFWWPQTETIIASLYAYLATGDDEYIYKHQRISEWTYAHFPDAEFGEWYGYLHRDGTVAQPAKGNLFKGPFPHSENDDQGILFVPGDFEQGSINEQKMRNMIFSANISKVLCLATMGITLMMPAQVAAAIPEMAVEAQAVNGQDGITVFPNKEAQYRIPAIVECKSGKLIAFTDHRYHNKDIGGGRHLDIVMKTSMDKGATWSSPEQMVAKGGNGIATSFDCAHGDAAVVVDKKSGRILLMCASGGIGYWESKRGQSPDDG